jgi:hypothetical protein
MINLKTISHFVQELVLIGSMFQAHAQEVSIPEPGLNTAIREAMQKPIGSLKPT